MNLSCKSSSPGLAPVAKCHGCRFLRMSRRAESWVTQHTTWGPNPPAQPQAPPCKVKGSLGTEPPGPLQASVSEFRIGPEQAGPTDSRGKQATKPLTGKTRRRWRGSRRILRRFCFPQKEQSRQRRTDVLEPHPDLPAIHAALQRTLTSRPLYLLFSELHFLSF